jgi:DNA helicase-2/ATP-dependent DNA helicase PcrA
VEQYLLKYNPVQLQDSSKVKISKNYKSINFGESKGLTFDRVIIYPTQPFVKWINDNNHKLASMSRSKFYVALTRAKYSVAIIYNYEEDTEFEGLQKFTIKGT